LTDHNIGIVASANLSHAMFEESMNEIYVFN